ncbi:unnamed protein product [Rotaria sp. Silwood2]|nr:unnamed protein product [Rotaria sp. Silwood2]CAF2621893.1 unnamed protein product [Rotaria sp. Silwood2]CAF2860651.1 unnamed protein product [Rotaria sp. Silwood2]CAF3027585.1 unnamed protein product [Rotaria sp. Silwood2]CAF4121429.1 unnamed protein product [Rotaria sp. Silwood2]
MGVVSSMCKCKKKRDNHDAIIHNNYTQTVNELPSISNNKAQCSAMSREPTNSSSFRYHYYVPSNEQIYSTSAKQIRGHSDFPLFSTPFYFPFNGQSNRSYHRSNPYVAQAYSHIDAPASSSIYNMDRSRSILTTSTTDSSHVPSTSDIIQTTGDEHRTESYRTLRHIESSMTTDKNEQSLKENIDDESHLVKRTVSAPIDMFLIDISNEHALVGQPISMNIRHLFLDTLENNHTNSSTPIRIEPASITKYAHENLLNYIPYVCDRYPNATVDSDQLTRNTLHVRMPSQFSHSFNALT